MLPDEIATLRASRKLLADKVDMAQRRQADAATDQQQGQSDEADPEDVPAPWAPFELRVFSGPQCPDGWTEHQATKGYVLVGRPADTQVPTFINSAMEVGETGSTCSGALQVAEDRAGADEQARVVALYTDGVQSLQKRRSVTF